MRHRKRPAPWVSRPGSMTQPLFQCLASTLACLPGPHVTDLGLIDGTTGELVPDLFLV